MRTAVVILNWNGVDFLKQFLPTLITHTPQGQVVVIDNRSTDESLQYISKHYSSIRVIENETNNGFAKGYNEGLKQLEGEYDYYALINSDVEVTKDWLPPLVNKLEEDSKIAGVQPKVLAYHKKTHFEHAGASGGFMDKNFYPFCRGRIFNNVEKDYGQYDNIKEIFWATGACMVVRASVFHQLEGFDNDFFAHMEEIDFCWRAKIQGHSFYVVPASKVYHVGGGTLNYESPGKTYLNFRNNLYAIHKNYEGWLFGKIVYRMSLDGVAGGKYLMALQFRHLIAILKAHFSYYRNIPKLQKKRKKIQRESKNYNEIGMYKASILWAFFFKRIKVFRQLNKRFFIH